MPIFSPNFLKTNEFQDGQPAGSITASDIRDFIDSVCSLYSTTQSGTTYTLALADAGTCVEMTSASANTVTVPPNSSVAFPIYTAIRICQYGTGQTTIAAGVGVTIDTPSALVLRTRYSEVTIRQRAANEWVLSGDTV
jgi:hypothetical protein